MLYFFTKDAIPWDKALYAALPAAAWYFMKYIVSGFCALQAQKPETPQMISTALPKATDIATYVLQG